jgi:hypothetical protein
LRLLPPRACFVLLAGADFWRFLPCGRLRTAAHHQAQA